MSMLGDIWGDLTGKKTKNTAKDYLKTAPNAQTQAQAAAGQPSGSAYMDARNPYVAKYGDNNTANSAMYADTTTNAYKPLADDASALYNQPGVQTNVDPAFRQYQLGLAQQLQQQANGTGPSLAQMQLQQATDQSLNNSLAAIRANGGPNGALNARTAALAGSQQLGAMGQNSAILRLQEQQQAQQALAGLANQGRQLDLGTETLRNTTGLANQSQKIDLLGTRRNIAEGQISGTTDILSGKLDISRQAQKDREARLAQREAELRQSRREMAGAAINGLSTLGSAYASDNKKKETSDE